LTARVAVNRLWQQLFGTGIVRSSEDFGSQGDWPSHPELLDWLAVEFMESGWDVKQLQRLIVTSATFRQAADVSPEILARDPQNRWLARGPRIRLDAEVIRDSALAASGLLVGEIGGKSVKPYQPDGLWEAVGYSTSNTAHFVQDHGAALYRRSLYTFWKRTSPPPTMQILDAPSREVCTVRRPRTNSPAAALALLNDVQFVEAARQLAVRILSESPTSDNDERLATAYRLVLARRPDRFERELLQRMLHDFRRKYQEQPELAMRFVSVGESSPDKRFAVDELAAWTMIASTLLNLDETMHQP
jgi:hypothetical protein